MTLLALVLMGVVVLLAIPTLTFVAQVLLGAWSREPLPRLSTCVTQRGSVVVLVPAHNETVGIATTVQSVLPQLRPGDRLLVVADNCTDDTAAVARALGAEVTERFHDTLRGKGFALDHGVSQLRSNAPDMVLMVDADCTLHPCGLDRLARECQTQQRPVQGCDLMVAPLGASLKTKVAAFAWVVKNKVRPLGGAKLRWPCQLMGTGMIFPWPLIESAPLASGHLAEDMQLGAVLAAQGHWPAYCDQAMVTSNFPTDAGALVAQRTRWEHGHLSMILSQGPTMLSLAFRKASWPLLGMALDMCVPPLTSLVMALTITCALCALFAWFTDLVWPLYASAGLMAALILAVLSAWWRHGKTLISGSELLSIPLYALAKVPIYAAFLARRQTSWIRTHRDDEAQ